MIRQNTRCASTLPWTRLPAMRKESQLPAQLAVKTST